MHTENATRRQQVRGTFRLRTLYTCISLHILCIVKVPLAFTNQVCEMSVLNTELSNSELELLECIPRAPEVPQGMQVKWATSLVFYSLRVAIIRWLIVRALPRTPQKVIQPKICVVKSQRKKADAYFTIGLEYSPDISVELGLFFRKYERCTKRTQGLQSWSHCTDSWNFCSAKVKTPVLGCPMPVLGMKVHSKFE